MNNMHGMMPVNQGMHPGMMQQNSPQQQMQGLFLI